MWSIQKDNDVPRPPLPLPRHPHHLRASLRTMRRAGAWTARVRSARRDSPTCMDVRRASARSDPLVSRHRLRDAVVAHRRGAPLSPMRRARSGCMPLRANAASAGGGSKTGAALTDVSALSRFTHRRSTSLCGHALHRLPRGRELCCAARGVQPRQCVPGLHAKAVERVATIKPKEDDRHIRGVKAIYALACFHYFVNVWVWKRKESRLIIVVEVIRVFLTFYRSIHLLN